MKVVLFCGGLGTRIRDYSENIPKPMIPVGNVPILWHIMRYYDDYGHNDFVLCLGYKASVIKEFFLSYRPQIFSNCVVTGFGKQIDLLETAQSDNWRVSLIDTGVWRNIGQRLWAVREHVQNEDVFMANYSDGLTDVNLDDMVSRFMASDKIGCFLAIRPPLTYHIADIDENGKVRDFISSERAEIWINGGYFIFRKEIFDYMREGEELVLEPFSRLIKEQRLMAYKHTGFWRSMDTLRDRQILEDMTDNGKMPWRPSDTRHNVAVAGE
jgi:glucose-1-phosphate cytidylyltransferase